jgi:lysyl-tRNA synthetase class 2
MEEENKIVAERREKLKHLRAAGAAYPNDFRRRDFAVELHKRYASRSKGWRRIKSVPASPAA